MGMMSGMMGRMRVTGDAECGCCLMRCSEGWGRGRVGVISATFTQAHMGRGTYGVKASSHVNMVCMIYNHKFRSEITFGIGIQNVCHVIFFPSYFHIIQLNCCTNGKIIDASI